MVLPNSQGSSKKTSKKVAESVDDLMRWATLVTRLPKTQAAERRTIERNLGRHLVSRMIFNNEYKCSRPNGRLENTTNAMARPERLKSFTDSQFVKL
jgi:hypothetical protein